MWCRSPLSNLEHREVSADGNTTTRMRNLTAPCVPRSRVHPGICPDRVHPRSGGIPGHTPIIDRRLDSQLGAGGWVYQVVPGLCIRVPGIPGPRVLGRPSSAPPAKPQQGPPAPEPGSRAGFGPAVAVKLMRTDQHPIPNCPGRTAHASFTAQACFAPGGLAPGTRRILNLLSLKHAFCILVLVGLGEIMVTRLT